MYCDVSTLSVNVGLNVVVCEDNRKCLSVGRDPAGWSYLEVWVHFGAAWWSQLGKLRSISQRCSHDDHFEQLDEVKMATWNSAIQKSEKVDFSKEGSKTVISCSHLQELDTSKRLPQLLLFSPTCHPPHLGNPYRKGSSVRRTGGGGLTCGWLSAWLGWRVQSTTIHQFLGGFRHYLNYIHPSCPSLGGSWLVWIRLLSDIWVCQHVSSIARQRAVQPCLSEVPCFKKFSL